MLHYVAGSRPVNWKMLRESSMRAPGEGILFSGWPLGPSCDANVSRGAQPALVLQIWTSPASFTMHLPFQSLSVHLSLIVLFLWRMLTNPHL